MRPTNRIDDALAQRIRDAIAGRTPPKAARKPKAPAKAQQRVAQFYRVEGDCHTLQLPLYFERAMWNSGGPSWLKRSTATSQRESVLLSMRATYRWTDEQRASVRHVAFVRLSPATLDDDNLRSAFKYAKDAVYAWLEHGDRQFNVKGIGHCDRRIKVPCSYQQQKCEANPRAHGIQIKLYI